jgi:hypothetical protein
MLPETRVGPDLHRWNCGSKVSHAHQIVGSASETEYPVHSAHPAMTYLAHQGNCLNQPEKNAVDVRGIWSGTLYSKHSNVVPFTITVEINPDARGRLIGASSLISDCLKGAKLQVTVTGSTVVLAGSDEEGDNSNARGARSMLPGLCCALPTF